MENNNKNNIANTMEINAILEEARRNRSGASAPKSGSAQAQKRPVTNSQPQKRQAAKPQQTSVRNQQPDQIDIQNGYVVYDEPKRKGNKKGKKTGLVIAIVAAVLVLVLGAGFCVYTFMGDFEYASNVYVNDIAIGGMSEREAEALIAEEEQRLAQSININVTAADKTSTITKDDISCEFNTDEVLAQAKQYSEDTLVPTGEQKYYISLKVNDETLDAVTKKVCADLNQKAVNAMVTKFDSSKSGNDRFVIEDAMTGVEVDADAFKAQLESFLESGNVSGDIEAKSTNTDPKYTKEYLLNNIKKLSTFSTISTNGSNGNHNMKLALSACNNSIINPDEIWSFNKCTGDSNQSSRGYKSAGVIVNGQSSTGIGGGICQASTTIYNAGLLCGLHVQERQCHYYKSTYVDAGRDATIDYGNIDLKFKNTFDYQLFMECYMEGTKLTCVMYGLENPDFDEVKISSSVTSHFSNGFRATTSRAFYKDGKRVTGDHLPDEDLPSSTYYTSAPGGSSSNNRPTTQDPTQDGTTADPETGTDTPVTPPEGGGTEGGGTEGGGTEGGGSEGGGSEGGGSEGGGFVEPPADVPVA